MHRIQTSDPFNRAKLRLSNIKIQRDHQTSQQHKGKQQHYKHRLVTNQIYAEHQAHGIPLPL